MNMGEPLPQVAETGERSEIEVAKSLATPGVLRMAAATKDNLVLMMDPGNPQREDDISSGIAQKDTLDPALISAAEKASKDARQEYATTQGDKTAEKQMDAWKQSMRDWILAQKDKAGFIDAAKRMGLDLRNVTFSAPEANNAIDTASFNFYKEFLNGGSHIGKLKYTYLQANMSANEGRVNLAQLKNDMQLIQGMLGSFGHKGQLFTTRDIIVAEGMLRHDVGKQGLEDVMKEKNAVQFSLGDAIIQQGEGYKQILSAAKLLKNAEEERKNNQENPASWENIRALATREDIATPGELQADLVAAIEVVKDQGGIVEVTNGLPTIAIPDLHARRDMLYVILSEPSGIIADSSGRIMTNYEALAAGRINIVLSGDLIHSERKDHWSDPFEYALYQHDAFGRIAKDSVGNDMLTQFGRQNRFLLSLQKQKTVYMELCHILAKAKSEKNMFLVSRIDSIFSELKSCSRSEYEAIIEKLPYEVKVKLNTTQTGRQSSPALIAATEEIFMSNFSNLDTQIKKIKDNLGKKLNISKLETEMMDAEMRDNLGLMQMVWRLQHAFPDSFKVVMGTHDDITGEILNASKYGVRQTEKFGRYLYAHEMTDILTQWNAYMIHMALDVKGVPEKLNAPVWNVSHTMPGIAYAYDEIMQRKDITLIRQFIYNRNKDRVDPTEATVASLAEEIGLPTDRDVLWLNGHDPVGTQIEHFRNITRIIVDDDTNYRWTRIPGVGESIFDPNKDIIVRKLVSGQVPLLVTSS